MKPQHSPLQPSRSQAVLVGIDINDVLFEDRLAEAVELVTSAGAGVADTVTGRRAKPDSSTFAGSGKVDEIAAAVAAHDANLVVFNHQLSPIQIRNVEKVVGVRVIDRTDLILDIFGQRARSAEGKLQVELAQMQHLLTRLVRGWTHLERQRGGIGMRGPGETQLETDRRLLGNRVKLLKERLEKLSRQRGVQRKARMRGDVLNVSLVGYTNAGKSTLFNALTHAGVFAANQLFATLDTTSRKLWIEGAGNIVISDTVGFIRDLPHSLVDAFHATLEAAIDADLLLHVVDSASHARDEQMVEVDKVLAEIGAQDVRQVIVWNKIDLTEAASGVVRDEYGNIARVRVSARSGEGLDVLRESLAEYARSKAESRQEALAEAARNAQPDYMS